MILTLLINNVKSFILLVVNIFRRALCCFRRRKRSFGDSVPLTHVITKSEDGSHDYQKNWCDWEDPPAIRKPKTVQDHIELYRKQKVQASQVADVPEEDQLNFFEDMSPKITKQTKILLNTSDGDSKTSNRLNFSEDSIHAPSLELREWEESNGWENEILDSDAQKVLREKKRQERERRAWEQQQKRMEKASRSLGSRLTT